LRADSPFKTGTLKAKGKNRNGSNSLMNLVLIMIGH